MINNNDKKYIIKRIIVGIVLISFVFLIKQCNVSAYSYKASTSVKMRQFNYSDTVSSNSEKGYTVHLEETIEKNGYDYLQVRFNKILYESTDSFSVDNPVMGTIYNPTTITCTLWENNNVCKTFSISGGNSNFQNDLNGQLNSGDNFFRIISRNTDGVATPCFISGEISDSILCPINKDISRFEYTIYQRGYDYFRFTISFSGVGAYWNNDSTDIVNGLSGVQQQQQQTNDTLTDSNISGANTNTNSAISGIQNNVDSTLNDAINPNSLNTLLTGFVNQLSNSTCTPITLPIPYTNENIILPCLGTEFSERIPIIWSLYELIITGVIVLRFWQHAVEYVLNILDPYHIGANNVPTGGGK